MDFERKIFINGQKNETFYTRIQISEIYDVELNTILRLSFKTINVFNKAQTVNRKQVLLENIANRQMSINAKYIFKNLVSQFNKTLLSPRLHKIISKHLVHFLRNALNGDIGRDMDIKLYYVYRHQQQYIDMIKDQKRQNNILITAHTLKNSINNEVYLDIKFQGLNNVPIKNPLAPSINRYRCDIFPIVPSKNISHNFFRNPALVSILILYLLLKICKKTKKVSERDFEISIYNSRTVIFTVNNMFKPISFGDTFSNRSNYLIYDDRTSRGDELLISLNASEVNRNQSLMSQKQILESIFESDAVKWIEESIQSLNPSECISHACDYEQLDNGNHNEKQ
ncbi:hypothetical protein RF11_04466 [Thelohanellus kitauei]|uniref:Uncharacterized protein n=1 Tax=Thelohanellus kitauei TaxID=669202 RepID=A0A0C2IYD1_THEKT|nr:hypothetical protein RF11_04466 [Thelohanellus kitauei]